MGTRSKTPFPGKYDGEGGYEGGEKKKNTTTYLTGEWEINTERVVKK